MSKIGLLVWSMDRAGQLDLLLQSIDKFMPNTFETHILYKASNQDYNKGYDKCYDYHPDCIFHMERNFQRQTLDIMSIYDYLAISTDDTVVFQAPPVPFTTDLMRGIDIFALRLGFNTTVQEPFTQRTQPALSRYQDEGDTLVWDFRLYEPYNNYGYPYGMDMHVYSRRYYDLVKEIPFKRTNDIEGYLSINMRNYINPFIRSFKHSIAVNIPSNNLSGVTQADNSLSFEEVNKKFLDGYRFRLKEIEEESIVGCHQLVSLVMTN